MIWPSSIRENGYVVIPDAPLSAAEIAELRAETLAICQGERGEMIRGDLDERHAEDADILRRYLCIHFPHKFSELMYNALSHPVMVDVLTQVIGPNVKCMQSMLFIKASGKPGQAWHQDEYFIPTRDRSLTGGWIALDDATVENGGLWVIPGSHRHGVIWPQWDHDDPRFDCAGETYGFPYTDEDAIPVEVEAGAIVFCYAVHRSPPNRRAVLRIAESALLQRRNARCCPTTHPKEGEHIAVADYRDIEMIAGVDPYAWKGRRSGQTLRAPQRRWRLRDVAGAASSD
ncbi:MAG: phytanoyl-CoA dioxygenase family protein [Caldilineaceae bacterium]